MGTGAEKTWGVLAVLAFVASGCSAGDGATSPMRETMGGGAGFDPGTVLETPSGEPGDAAVGQDLTTFTKGKIGAFKLGAPLSSASAESAQGSEATGVGCGGVILGIVRDFARGDQGGHPDFETFNQGQEDGIVESGLGADQKPVYVDGFHRNTSNRSNFDQWYRNVDGVNQPFLLYLAVEKSGNVFTFESNDFFPLDGTGFGNQGFEHNYGFTTEIHTNFKYGGGETFSFTGDDDLWVFINKKLAIDIGGVHPASQKSISLDERAAEFGLKVGEVYSLDLFQAERHTYASNFRIDTNLDFVNCGKIVDVDIK